MASTQSQAVAALYRTWLANPADGDLIRDQAQWDVLTAEPGGVDYLECEIGPRRVMWAVPKGCAEDRVLLCLHGGGFVSGSMYSHRKLFAHLAKRVGARALLVSYPLLPDGGVYPVPVDDAVSAYRWLLDGGIAAGHIALVGDSAGGLLAITAQLRAREDGLPLPAATMLMSPWVDMEVMGETMVSTAGKDALFNQPWVKQLAEGYLGGRSPQDPYTNPLYADLTGFGPLYSQVGGEELLLDDSRRLAEHAEKAGVEVRLDVFPEMQHTFQMMVGRAPEADDAIGRFAVWVRPKLGLGNVA